MEKRRVVITGLGAVTPLGHTARETWEAAKAGVCGIAPITLYDHSAQKVSLAGEVKEFDPSGVLEKKEIRRMDRFAQFAVTAAAEAMTWSGRTELGSASPCPAASAASAPSRPPARLGRAGALTGSPPSSSPW